MSPITPTQHRDLVEKPRTYAKQFTEALKKPVTTDNKVHLVQDYIGMFSEPALIKRWGPVRLKINIHDGIDIISRQEHSAVRAGGYKTVIEAVQFIDIFNAIGKRPALEILDKTLELIRYDEDDTLRRDGFKRIIQAHTNTRSNTVNASDKAQPLYGRVAHLMDAIDWEKNRDIRLESYGHLAKALQKPELHKKFSDQQTVAMIDRFQKIVTSEQNAQNEQSAAFYNLAVQYKTLLHKGAVMESLWHAQAGEFTFKGLPETRPAEPKPLQHKIIPTL